MVASSKGSKHMVDKNADTTVDNGTNVERIALYTIKSDLDWNSRNKLSVLQEGGSGDEGESGRMTTDELSASIEVRDQDTPVHVIANPDKKDAQKFPYILRAGFKRWEAMRRLAERSLHNNVRHPIKVNPSWDSKNPTILAKIDIGLSESDALLLNVRENTARANLTMPDTAWAIKRINESLAAEGKSMTDTQLAADLGLSQGYLSKLHRVVDAVKGIKGGEILKNWREARNPLPLKQMEAIVKQSTPERIWESYATAIGGAAAPAASGDADKDPNAWLAKAKDAASEVGVIIGVLESLGQIPKEVAQEIDWETCISDLIKIKKGADVKEVVMIGRQAQAGYVYGLTKKVTEEAEEAQAKAEKVKAKLNKANEKADGKNATRPAAVEASGMFLSRE